jgi:hypothetical protein
MAPAKKTKTGTSKKVAKAGKAPSKRANVPARIAARPKAKRRPDDAGGIDNFANLIDHPLVADLLAIGAIAAVAAIADHRVSTRSGRGERGSKQAMKAAGKAAAAAIGRRLMTEIEEIKLASKKKSER